MLTIETTMMQDTKKCVYLLITLSGLLDNDPVPLSHGKRLIS